MRRNFILIFILSLIPVSLLAQYDDPKYLTGAVPEVDGKVIFTKDFNYPSQSEQQIFEVAQTFAKKFCEDSKDSRIVYSNEESGDLAVAVSEYLVFKSSALSLDRALMFCNIVLHSQAGKLSVTVKSIHYQYVVSSDPKPVKYTAEEMITDANALTKKNTLPKGLGKFRVATIDFANKVFAKFENTVAASNVIVPVVTTTPIVTEPIVVVPTVTAGFVAMDLDKIPQTIIKMLPESAMAIQADKSVSDKDAKWQGFGKMMGKNTVSVSIKPDSELHKGIADNESYKIEFSNDNQVWFIINCHKIGESTNSGETTLIGEVISIEVK